MSLPPSVSIGKNGEFKTRWEVCEDVKLVAGRVSARGLGYAIAGGFRKPIYPTVSEGSILYLKPNQNDLEYGAYAHLIQCARGQESVGQESAGSQLGKDVMEKLETLGRLGFGTFVALGDV